MSDWITDRQPILDDAMGSWFAVMADGIVFAEPPKPKRREWTIFVDELNQVRFGKGGDEGVKVREVLPGDPDIDVVLEVLAEIKEASKPDGRVTPNIVAKSWFNRIEESRSK